jgi:rubrerythrin
VSPGTLQSALQAELRRALMAEIGARSIYAQLAARMRDAELRQVLAIFRDDEDVLVEGVRALILAAGAKRAPHASLTRTSMSWLLAVTSRGKSSSIALRLCHDSECTVARWYHDIALELARGGQTQSARACTEFAQTKHRHARALEAWVVR